MFALRKTPLVFLMCVLWSHGFASDDEVRVGRYTAVKTGPEAAEIQPLRGIVQLDFPQHVRSVFDAAEHLLQSSGYTLSVDTSHKSLLKGFRLPAVHRTLGPIKLIDGLQTILGPSRQIHIDERLRVVSIDNSRQHGNADSRRAVQDSETSGNIDEAIIAHHDQITLSGLIDELIPAGWSVSYQISPEKINQLLVFHAETTRRRALEQLFEQLRLTGTFYPGDALLLVQVRRS